MNKKRDSRKDRRYKDELVIKMNIQLAKTLLGVKLPTESRESVREKILKDASDKSEWAMVSSLNPEILTIAFGDFEFKKILESSKYTIIDGVGVVVAAQILNIPVGERYTGVDLMADLLREASRRRLRVMLIGGLPNLADKLVDCYSSIYPELEIFGLQGIQSISRPTESEERNIFSIVADRKPHIIFVAFGSPMQEKWIFKNRAQLGKAVCIGVGGAFDFLSGRVSRAPVFVRSLGLEWLFRLVVQPWRWRRQLRLVTFMIKVAKQRIQG